MMKYIALVVESGPPYDPFEPMHSLDHQARQSARTSTILESVKAVRTELQDKIEKGETLPKPVRKMLPDTQIKVIFSTETGEPVQPGEPWVATAYVEYRELPKGEIAGRNRGQENIYNTGWCVHTGMACISPHPHRHYTHQEFYEQLGIDKTLADRFLPK